MVGMDVWLMRTDTEGDLLWEQTYDSCRMEQVKTFLMSVMEKQTSDGGFVLLWFGIEPDQVSDEDSPDNYGLHVC